MSGRSRASPDPDRRQFLAALLGMGGTLPAITHGGREPAPRVEMESTVFYAQPDAQRVLVRFHVHGTTAPAGRLRAYDGARNLLGTAGVLPVGDGHLYGELWVPLLRDRRIVSELSAPGERPTWSFHTIRPEPRWVVHVLAVVDASALLDRLLALEPGQRAAEAAALAQRPVYGGVMPEGSPALLDHATFLHMGRAAALLHHQFGVPASTVAVGSRAQFDVPTIPLVLNGFGIRHAVIHGVTDHTVLRGPAGSLVNVAPPGMVGDPARLAMFEGGPAMARAVERWLSALPREEGPAAGRAAAAEVSAFVVGTRADDIGEAAVRTAEEWNARYAYPRLVLDGTPPAIESLASRAGISGSAPSLALSAGPASADVPLDTTMIPAAVLARRAEAGRRVEQIVGCLASAAGWGPTSLVEGAGRLATRLPGTLVFNPSPFTRSDVARFPDGSERLVTDVPGIGYAFVPHLDRESDGWQAEGSGVRADGLGLSVEMDAATGAIGSLVSAPGDTQWVRAGRGLAEWGGGRVESVARLALPGVGSRLRADRRDEFGQKLVTHLTTYDALPWVDVVVEPSDDRARRCEFAFAMSPLLVEWEIPIGMRDAAPPLDNVPWLRWIRLTGEGGSALIASVDAPIAGVDADGTVTTHIAGPARFRLAIQPAGAERYREDPWRLGWSVDPFVTAPVTGQGPTTLPSFASLVETSDPGAPIIAMEPEDDRSLMVFVQDLLGLARPVSLRAGLVTFRDARRVDYLGRDEGPIPTVDGQLSLDLPARGVVALRLLDIGLSAS